MYCTVQQYRANTQPFFQGHMEAQGLWRLAQRGRIYQPRNLLLPRCAGGPSQERHQHSRGYSHHTFWAVWLRERWLLWIRDCGGPRDRHDWYDFASLLSLRVFCLWKFVSNALKEPTESSRRSATALATTLFICQLTSTLLTQLVSINTGLGRTWLELLIGSG